MPSNPTKSGYTFNGWYTAANGGGSAFNAATTVTGNITVYVWWKSFDDLSLDDALTWIENNAVAGDTYSITLKNNETIAPRTLSYNGKQVGITLTGGTTERTVSLSANGTLFVVDSGVTMTLGNNVTLQGRNNTGSMVRVNSGGTLVMNTGSKISDNTSSSSYSYYSSVLGSSGGVFVYGGTFTMSGGTISNNTSAEGGGGVVVFSSGAFIMSGGTISNNISPYAGGGVLVQNGATFIMSNGTINGNISSDAGGGVIIAFNGAFTMSGGAISGNTALAGGGVYVFANSTLTMSGGIISNNTASDAGGGVYVSGNSTFTKQAGSIIYGSNGTTSLRNTATSGNDYGHAVYVDSSPAKKRNTTAGTSVIMVSGISGSAGGWE
jgi:uncharacterized repeat protein (TIGR02543 family)